MFCPWGFKMMTDHIFGITDCFICISSADMFMCTDIIFFFKMCIRDRVRVDPNDPAFENPSKPIGKFLTKEEADHQAKAYGHIMKEDAGRGYRRVVASPKPVEIVEQDAINSLVDANKIVICCGGGGIPVVLNGHHLKGASAVIDKDYASCLLAKELDADMLIILTAVEKVAVNFGKENEEWLDDITVDDAKKYINEGQFAPGSMLPKVQDVYKRQGSHCLICFATGLD